MQDNPASSDSSVFSSIQLPSLQALKRLAISETGFIFDPSTGHSFSVNETGLIILQDLQQHKSLDEILESLLTEYQIGQAQLERDLIEFVGLLRKQVQDIEP